MLLRLVRVFVCNTQGLHLVGLDIRTLIFNSFVCFPCRGLSTSPAEGFEIELLHIAFNKIDVDVFCVTLLVWERLFFFVPCRRV